MRQNKFILFTVIVLIMILVSGCVQITVTEDNDGEGVYTSAEVIDKGDAEEVMVNVKMGAGELNVSSGALDLLEGSFRYSQNNWKPEVEYSTRGKYGTLNIEQPSIGSSFNIGNYEYKWDLKLNDQVPMDLDIKLGAGKAELKLGELYLKDLNIKMGAGDVKVDLTGSWRDDVSVDIKGGVGKSVIVVPSNIGVKLNTKTGIGSLKVIGLRSVGDGYVNELYGDSDVVMKLDIVAGIGEVIIEVEN